MNLFDLEAVLTLNDQAYEQGIKKAREEINRFKSENDTKSSNVSQAWNIAAVAIGNIISNVFSKVTSTISSAVDGAISRVDILNNYSIVMEGLGYSAKEADTAINKLSDGIQGLPTTLPGIVTVQKQFAALLGSMDDATELTLALNNAVVAGGQGQQVANSALNQWYQILANGKPDLQSWRIINQAMPAQLDQLAKSISGASATSSTLFSDWQKGIITTDQVREAMMQLNTQGINGFDNFAQQAQNASKGIATSMQNIKTKVVTVLGNIIQASMDSGLDITGILDTVKSEIGDFGKEVQKGLKGVDFGEISDKIKKLIKLVFDALKKVDWAKLINTTLDAITKLVTFVTKHFKGILTLVKGIAAAFVGWKIGGIISNVVNSVKGFINAIKAAKAGQEAFNIAANANPIGLIVTAVTTLIAILPDLLGYFEDWLTSNDKQRISLERVKEQAEENAQAWNDMKDSMKSGSDSADAEAVKLERLADELKNCYDENGNLISGMEDRAQFIVGELNSAMGTEYNAVSMTKEEYDQMTASIYANIEATKAKALMSNFEDEYTEALTNQKKAYDDLITASQAVADKEKQIADERALWQQATSEQDRLFIEDRIKGYEEDLEALKSSYDQSYEAYKGYVDTQSAYEEAQLLIADKNYAEAAELLQNFANNYGLTGQALAKSNQTLANQTKTYMESMLKRAGYTGDQITTLMKGITEDMDITEALKTIGKNGVDGFGAGFLGNWESVRSQILGHFSGLSSSVMSLLGIHSPSRVFMGIGKNTSQGFELGFDDEFQNTKKTFMNDIESLVDYGKNLDFGEVGISQATITHQVESTKTQAMFNNLNESLNKLANMQIVMDSGELVGATAPKMDSALGNLAIKNSRSVFA